MQYLYVNVLVLLSVLYVVEMGQCAAASCLLAVKNAVQVCSRLRSSEADSLNHKHTHPASTEYIFTHTFTLLEALQVVFLLR